MIATEKALKIEADIRLEQFDRTLTKYQSDYTPIQSPPLAELWEKYTEFKARSLTYTTINKDYRTIRNRIAKFPSQDPQDAIAIRRHLSNTLTPGAAKKTLQFVTACCRWAVEENLLKRNPFHGLEIKARPRRPQIHPFTESEKTLILSTYQGQDPHYFPVVQFALWTGCRPSETAALLWQHIDPDMTAITIMEAVVEGHRKDTKTHQVRVFPINHQLRNLLISIRPGNFPTAPIFTSPNGASFDPHNFLNRSWRPILTTLPIPYRVFYNCRHTFITGCLERGISVTQVATWVGNSPKIIYERYAGLIKRSDVPEF
jgi:integrase